MPAKDLSAKDIAKIVERQAPGFRVAEDQTVYHRKKVVAGSSTDLDVVRRRFANAAPRKSSGLRRMAPPIDEEPAVFEEPDNIAVIIEPKDGEDGPGRKSILIDPTTKRITSAQG
jgi:hypothetical protein